MCSDRPGLEGGTLCSCFLSLLLLPIKLGVVCGVQKHEYLIKRSDAVTAQIRSIFANSHSLFPACVSSELFRMTTICWGSGWVGSTPSIGNPCCCLGVLPGERPDESVPRGQGADDAAGSVRNHPTDLREGRVCSGEANAAAGKHILSRGTAWSSVGLDAPVKFRNPATDPSCHTRISGSWPWVFVISGQKNDLCCSLSFPVGRI